MNKLIKIIFVLSFLLPVCAQGQAVTWQKLYDGPNHYSDIGTDICELTDGNYITVGSTQISQRVMYVIKLNVYGDTIWTKVIIEAQLATCVTYSNDGGCVLPPLLVFQKFAFKNSEFVNS